jgi:hypothetical protein
MNRREIMKVLGKHARKTMLLTALRVGGVKYAKKIKKELSEMKVYIS